MSNYDTLVRQAGQLEMVVPTVLGNLAKAEERTQKFMVSLALERSSGRYSMALLAAMGHPYSTRDPHPPMHPGIINVQSGVFKRSWQDVAVRTADFMGSSMWNNAPHAVFLEDGTPRMISRPLVELVLMDVVPYHERLVAQALTNLLGGGMMAT